jgi:hypothetical protein
MKKLIVFLSLALTLVFTQTAVSAADGTFQSAEEINGSWLLEYTKISNQTKVRGDTWVFNNGTMIMKDIPRTRGDKYDSNPVEFIIEEGRLKISVLGRPGRFDIYSLVSKPADTLDLKSTLGEIFHFITK